jgi:hypothetical protein
MTHGDQKPGESATSEPTDPRSSDTVLLPKPARQYSDTKMIIREYDFPNGVLFALFSVYPDRGEKAWSVPASQWFEGMLGGELADAFQEQLERDAVLSNLPSVQWVDGSGHYDVSRVLRVQARDVPRALERLELLLR